MSGTSRGGIWLTFFSTINLHFSFPMFSIFLWTSIKGTILSNSPWYNKTGPFILFTYADISNSLSTTATSK